MDNRLDFNDNAPMPVPSPEKPLTPEELEKYGIRMRMRYIFNAAFKFKEEIWDDNPEFWEKAETHPLKFKARYADMTNVFSKPWAAKMMEEGNDKQQKKITADELEAMGLPDAAIDKLAAVNEDGDDT